MLKGPERIHSWRLQRRSQLAPPLARHSQQTPICELIDCTLLASASPGKYSLLDSLHRSQNPPKANQDMTTLARRLSISSLKAVSSSMTISNSSLYRGVLAAYIAILVQAHLFSRFDPFSASPEQKSELMASPKTRMLAATAATVSRVRARSRAASLVDGSAAVAGGLRSRAASLSGFV